MGFQAAVKVFEKGIGLSHKKHRFIIDKLNKYIIEEKIKSMQ